jgi:hypothetical protein
MVHAYGARVWCTRMVHAPKEVRMRAFRVRLPSGRAYWTVIDDEYQLVPAVDDFLRVRSKALPIAIAAHAAVLALMLLTKPPSRRRT